MDATSGFALANRGDARMLQEGRGSAGVELDQVGEKPPAARGCVSQPSRQPVIAQDFEKLLMTMSRSSGSATSRKDGAARRS